MKISGVVIVLNEEQNISKLIESLKGLDEIIIADGGSTDKTIELATSLGAKVIIRNDKNEVATENDIKEFVDKYGYKPNFDLTHKSFNFGQVRNEAISHAKNDWIFMPDADEIVTWDLTEIDKMTDQCDQIECKLVHSRKEDGTPISYNYITKLFKKSMSKWVGRNHEVVLSQQPVRIIRSETMKIDHYQKQGKSSCIANLEFAVLKDNDVRTKFYLAREYYYLAEYEKAIKMFNVYIDEGKWLPQLSEAYYFKAICYWKLNKGDKARQSCALSIVINANHKKAHQLMAEMSWEKNAQVWNKFAEIANNEDVVFR